VRAQPKRIKIRPSPVRSTMMKSIVQLPLCLGIALASIATATADVALSHAPAGAKPGAGKAASIPFANNGGIYNWQVVDDKTLLIESQGHQWYKATFMSSCTDLPFAERVGFESNPDGSFDRFSAVQVGHQRCQVVSFVRTTAPAKKPADKKPADKKPAAAS
jgi:hypothetical protein